ncbi:unnamed protein product, partial [Heterosigma akashiwo]
MWWWCKCCCNENSNEQMAETEADLRATNVDLMNELHGFDVVIVCTGNQTQASYWQTKLETGRGKVMAESTKVIAVDE